MAKGEGEALGVVTPRPSDFLDQIVEAASVSNSVVEGDSNSGSNNNGIETPLPPFKLAPLPPLPPLVSPLLSRPNLTIQSPSSTSTSTTSISPPTTPSPTSTTTTTSLSSSLALSHPQLCPKPILPAPSFSSLQDVHRPAIDGIHTLALLAEFNRAAFACDVKKDSSLNIIKPKVVKPRRKRKPRVPDNLYCRSCGSTETPEWRRGPDGEKSLCNACGLHFAKILRREQQSNPPKESNVNKSSINFLLN